MFNFKKNKPKDNNSDQHLFNGLASFLSNNYLLSEKAIKNIIEIIQVRQLKANDLLIKEDGSFFYEIVLLKGVLRAFYTNFNGDEINVSFFVDCDVVTPHFLRTIIGKSSINLQALENSEIGLIPCNDFQSACINNKEMMQFAEKITDKELFTRIEKERIYAKENAERRLDFFRNKFHGLENRIAHYHIASYLNITPISLSRIRANKK